MTKEQLANLKLDQTLYWPLKVSALIKNGEDILVQVDVPAFDEHIDGDVLAGMCVGINTKIAILGKGESSDDRKG